MRKLIIIIFAVVAAANALWFGCLTLEGLILGRMPIEASQRGTYGQVIGFFTAAGFVFGGWLMKLARESEPMNGSLAIVSLTSVMLGVLGGIMRFNGHDLSPEVIGPYHPLFAVGWSLGFALGGAALPVIWTENAK